jgi:hypothetical protein
MEPRQTVLSLECNCIVLVCMDGTSIVMICPKHNSTRTKLLEQESVRESINVA